MKSMILIMIAMLFISSCSHYAPIMATSNRVGNDKGEACARNILFVIPLSRDHTIYTAAKNGDIDKISTVDAEYFFSIFYNSRCTVVRGHKRGLASVTPPRVQPKEDDQVKVQAPSIIESDVDSEEPTPLSE